jgi:hypothetical protein
LFFFTYSQYNELFGKDWEKFGGIPLNLNRVGCRF